MIIEPGTPVECIIDSTITIGNTSVEIQEGSRGVVLMIEPIFLVQLFDNKDESTSVILSFKSASKLTSLFNCEPELKLDESYSDWSSYIDESHSAHIGVVKYSICYKGDKVGFFVSVQNGESVLMLHDPKGPETSALNDLIESLYGVIRLKGYELTLTESRLRYMCAIIIGQYITRRLNFGAINIADYAISCIDTHLANTVDIVGFNAAQDNPPLMS